jgi:hypothetical protein
MISVALTKEKWRKMRVSVIVICIISTLFFSCDDKQVIQEKTIYSDVEFVKTKFPALEEIESVEYYYIDVSSGSGLGPTPVEFSGVVHIGSGFSDMIYRDYSWSECDVEPNPDILGNFEYDFKYSEEFDENYAESLIGYFYYDKNKKL